MHRFGVDAAIVYSDILIIPSAMGLTVEMVPTRKQAEPKPGEPAKVESSGPMRPNFPNPLVEPSSRHLGWPTWPACGARGTRGGSGQDGPDVGSGPGHRTSKASSALCATLSAGAHHPAPLV